MMKWVFGLLLLLNIGFFAAMRWGSALTEDANSLGIQAALNADKITIINPLAPVQPQSESAVSAASAPVAVSAPVAAAPAAMAPVVPPENHKLVVAEPAPVKPATPAPLAITAPVIATPPAHVPEPAPAPLPAPVQAQAPGKSGCVEWGEFSGTDLHRAEAALSALGLGDKLKRRTVEYTSGYWVFIPPVKSKLQVEQRVEQLKQLEIEDYFVVKDAGVWKNAISLGVFKTESLAKRYFLKLQQLGLKYVKVEKHAKKLRFTVFDLSHLDHATVQKIEALHKDFPDSEMRNFSCK